MNGQLLRIESARTVGAGFEHGGVVVVKVCLVLRLNQIILGHSFARLTRSKYVSLRDVFGLLGGRSLFALWFFRFL
jgi:hypothetical protein